MTGAVVSTVFIVFAFVAFMAVLSELWPPKDRTRD